MNKRDPKDYLITDSVIHTGSATLDVFCDTFDITWAFENTYKEMKDRTLTLNPVELHQLDSNPEMDDGSIIYNYNNEWFRSDDFVKLSPENTNILFAGCSESEGIAGPLDEVWTKMLHDQIASKNNNVSGFYSLARAGFGWQKIISSFMIYVKKYGFPDYFFVLLPNVSRVFEWDEERKTWWYMQKFPIWYNEEATNHREFAERHATLKEHKEHLINFILSWKLFEHYCETNNVKLLWSTWDHEEAPNLSRFNQFNNYFEINNNEWTEFIKTLRPDGRIKNGDLYRRDGHSGKLKHLFWLNKFAQEITKKGWLNV